MTESKAQDFELIKQTLSVARFESYRKSAAEPDSLIFTRYQWDAKLSHCFYLPLQILEVVFRNSLDIAIQNRTKNPHWLLTVPPWIIPHSQKDDLLKAYDALERRTKPKTHARVVQEMSFGFWTTFLNSRYEPLFHSIGASVFPGMPTSIRTRANVSVRFERIRTIRNRVFHFRRIWNRPNLLKEYQETLESIAWINPAAARLLIPPDAESQFTTIIAAAPT